MRYYVLDDTDSIYGTAYTDGHLWYIDVWDNLMYSSPYALIWEHNCIPNGYRIVSKEELDE